MSKALEKFTTSSLRGSKKPARQQIIMLKIHSANRGERLPRIHKICELAYGVQDDKKISLEMELVGILSSVSSALLLTEKTRERINLRQYFDYYAVPWGFTITLETYDHYIKPWWQRNNVSCWSFKVPSLENFKVRKTTATCPYCYETLLDGPRTSNDEIMNQVTEELRGHIHFERNMLISQEEYRCRKAIDDSHYAYQPPTLEANILVCPRCKKRILLNSKFWRGNQTNIYGYVKPPKIKEKPLMIESYDFLDENAIPVTFKYASQWLEEKGYKDLVSAFLKWAEPQVTKIEFEIIKLVSEQTFWKFMDYEQEGKTEETEEDLE